MSDKKIKKIDLGKYKADGKKGLISEVYLEYPKDLHDLHNDYPVSPEKLNVSNNMLSGYCEKIVDEYKISIGLVKKLTSKPTYVSSKIFNENLMAVHKIKEVLTLNRPAYVGICIFDSSKTLMYDFHYRYIKEKYGNKAKLLFTDTNS